MDIINPEIRYNKMIYRRAGKSGLKLPIISLGLWYNFGEVNDYEYSKKIVETAFNNGITHFDLANNYGPPYGSAEITFGKILKDGLMKYRDEIIISTKAGYDMWPGVYGNGGSRKYLIASLNQSLNRLGLDYVDIFYHHCPDPETDIKETMLTLRDIVLSGKTIYVGLSNYNSEQLKEAVPILKQLNVPYVLHQPPYSMFRRDIEVDDRLKTQDEFDGGTICYSVLQQGILSNKYIDGVPSDSRANKKYAEYISSKNITPEIIEKLKKLRKIADNRQQTISQLAIAWSLRDNRMTSVLMGTSTIEQLLENLEAINNLDFTDEELRIIENIIK